MIVSKFSLFLIAYVSITNLFSNLAQKIKLLVLCHLCVFRISTDVLGNIGALLGTID